MALRQLMFLLLLLLLLGTLSTGHEYYSSTEEMGDLVTLDKNLMFKFTIYLLREVQHLETLSKVLEVLQNFSTDSGGGTIHDPITAYQLVRQLRIKFYTIYKYTKQRPSDDFLEYLYETYEDLPEQEEVDQIALGLIRLQEIYRLEPQGIMGQGPAGPKQESRLDADECFHLAKVAHNNEKFQIASLWLREAYWLLEREGKDKSEMEVTFKDIEMLLASSAFSLGDVQTAIRLTKATVDDDPADVEAWLRLLRYQVHRAAHPDDLDTPDLFTIPEPSSTSYEALCSSGYSRMTPRRQRGLFCRYSTAGGNPRLMYAPVKEEDEWDHPRIVRFHDILSEQEMDKIKLMAKPKLTRSKVAGYEKTGHVSDVRVSKTAWFKDDDDPVIARTSQRISDISGLDMTTAEPLQVLNYGVGGHYASHYDGNVQSRNGDRIATVLIYLTDVEVGGATVFPKIGAALQPKKGSAVMWFNLLQNGDLDELTEHAGCPVLWGNKWVANKWVHERGQEFRKRCSLNPWE